jgi:hypothetical protein
MVGFHRGRSYCRIAASRPIVRQSNGLPQRLERSQQTPPDGLRQFRARLRWKRYGVIWCGATPRAGAAFIILCWLCLDYPTHLRDRNSLTLNLIVSFRDRILAFSLDFFGMIQGIFILIV